MELVYYTLAGIVLYLFSDWILVRIERHQGNPLKHRSIIFFVIILFLAISSFKGVQYLLSG